MPRTLRSGLTGAALGAGLVGAGALALAWWRRNATGGIFGTPLPPEIDDPDQEKAPMTTRTATARYDGLGKDGRGQLSATSGVLDATPYGFGTRFGDNKGTNPEELIAAAHAGCFTMALSFALDRAGYRDGTLETRAAVDIAPDGAGFTITRSALDLTAHVPGIDPAEFARIAEDAKANCPVSKLLNAEITLTHRLD